MPTAINGHVDWSMQPLDWSTSILGGTFTDRNNRLMSANTPLRYIVQWERSGLDETVAPSLEGDVVHAIFKIYETNNGQAGATVVSNMRKVATIRKARDVRNVSYGGIGLLSQSTVPEKHIFSLDISPIVSELLSYSLVPIGKGTFENAQGMGSRFGGLNGGKTVQDNVVQGVPVTTVSPFRLSNNGGFRRIRVTASFEVLDADGLIVSASNPAINSIVITVINSVPQWEEDSVYYEYQYLIDGRSSGAIQTDRRLLTKCPNYNTTGNISDSVFKKYVRMTDEAEWAYFYIERVKNIAGVTDTASVYIKVDTDDGNTFYLNAFENNLYTTPPNLIATEQYQYIVQNISPAYMNSNGINASGVPALNQITASTTKYVIRVVMIESGEDQNRVTNYYYYHIDRETEHPFGYVRFHWLNRMGGIDSYTAKRNVTQSVEVTRNTFETRSADKLWLQTPVDGSYLDDSMRGDLYKGGREVLDIKANRNHSVYTEPLNTAHAKWLEEIITSPNVWIEYQSAATERLNTHNNTLRPSEKTYIPVIITNGEMTTVNQEGGLVSLNIEFTHAHSINTQRN